MTGSELFRRALTLSSRFVFKDDIANVNYDRPATAACTWILVFCLNFNCDLIIAVFDLAMGLV